MVDKDDAKFAKQSGKRLDIVETSVVDQDITLYILFMPKEFLGKSLTLKISRSETTATLSILIKKIIDNNFRRGFGTIVLDTMNENDGEERTIEISETSIIKDVLKDGDKVYVDELPN